MVSVGAIVGGTFGFARRNILAIAIWCAVYMVGAVLMSLLMQPMFDLQLDAMTAEIPHLSAGIFGYMMLIYLVLALTFLILFAAAFRAVLKPDLRAAGYLRLGMDELRLFGLMCILLFALWAACLALGIGAAISGVLLALLAGPIGAGIAVLLLYAALVGGLTYLSVRLSAAAPLTILRGRITIFDAWRLTRGRFWTLFGAYLSILLIVTLPFLCLFAFMASGFYHHIFNAPYDPTSFSVAMRAQLDVQSPGRPLWFLGIVGSGLFGGVAIALQGAMTAIATRELMMEKEMI